MHFFTFSPTNGGKGEKVQAVKLNRLQLL